MTRALFDGFRRNAADISCRGSRERVQYIVPPGDAELYMREQHSFFQYIKFRASVVKDYVSGGENSVRFKSEGNALSFIIPHRAQDVFAVGVIDGVSVVRDRRVLREGIYYVTEPGEIIGVVEVNIEYHRDVRREGQERILILARLHDERVLRADAVRSADLVHDRAENYRRVELRRQKDMGEHRRRRALSVHPGDTDTVLAPAHQPAEEIRAVDAVFLTGAVVFKRPRELGVVGLYRGGVDYHVLIVDVRRVELIIYLHAAFFERFCQCGRHAVIAADMTAALERDMRERGHTDAADTYEINGARDREYLPKALPRI